MKVLRTARLVFSEGRSEKVYELELCELSADHCILSACYGKQGTPLKVSSKQPFGSLREMEIAYDKLLAQLRQKGYRAPGEAPPARLPGPPDPVMLKPVDRAGAARREAKLLATLEQGGRMRGRSHAGMSRHVERAIWRAGELRLRAAESRLLDLIGSASHDGLRDYCIAWALGRLGGEASVPALSQLWSRPATREHVRRMAGLALLSIAPSSAEALRASLLTRLPDDLRTAVVADSAQAVTAALRAHLATGPSAYEVLEPLYALDVPHARAALCEALRGVPLEAPAFRVVRSVFKAAEYRVDAEIFGLLAYRFETTRKVSTRANLGLRADRPSTVAYRVRTQEYLRKRVVRTLRRAGALGDPDYVKLAVGVLLPFTDADLAPTASGQGTLLPLSLCFLLFGASGRFERSKGGRAVRASRRFRARPFQREEPFPALWDARPEGLMHLLCESRSQAVHEMAARTLRYCPGFFWRLEVADIALLAASPYEVTVQLALELTISSAEARTDLDVLTRLVNSSHAPARARALDWLTAAHVRVREDDALLAQLIFSAYADVRSRLAPLLGLLALTPAVVARTVERVIERLLLISGPDADQRAREATTTLLSNLPSALTHLGTEQIRALLGHELPGVQSLGGSYVAQAHARGDLDDDLLGAALHARSREVAARSLRVLDGMSASALADRSYLLIRLSADKSAWLRDVSRVLVARVVAALPNHAHPIARGLLDALLRRKLPLGAGEHLASLLNEELRTAVMALPRAEVLRLLASGSAEAQGVGALALARFTQSTFTLPEIVSLAGHVRDDVRARAWEWFDADEARVRTRLLEAVRIFDTGFGDTRAQAIRFFAERLADVPLGLDFLSHLLDSVHADVQAFGRAQLTRRMRAEDGALLLDRLSEHPAPAMQLFAAQHLPQHLAEDPARLEQFHGYFVSVLSRVHQGRLARERVLTLLACEGQKSERAGRFVLGLLHRVAAVEAVGYRGDVLAAMTAVLRAQPMLDSPLRIIDPPLRTRRALATSPVS